MEQADIDSSWLGPDDENYTIAESEFRNVIYITLIFTFIIFILYVYIAYILFISLLNFYYVLICNS